MLTRTLCPLFAITLTLLPHAGPVAEPMTTIDVDGELARISRDDYGVPHIFAETNRALFTAYGYAVAEDRLWQLEMNRRASQGRLAEVFGKQQLSPDFLGVPDAAPITADVADQNARTLGYTDQELDQQFARLTPEEQEIITAYVAGINRYLTGVVAQDPAARLPYEFQHLALPVPAPWTVRDAVRFFTFLARLFGDAGGNERANQTLLANLVAASAANQDPQPAAAGLGMFNDVRWVNDPEAPASVPADGAIGRRQKPVVNPGASQLAGADEAATGIADEQAKAAWQALGIPTGIGSYGWAVSAARSTTGTPLFIGAPGLGFNAPEVLHEVQLTGGNGFHVTGASLAGLPVVVVGRTERTAWTLMTAPSDNVDTYVETSCANGAGYIFNGTCTPYDTRIETILIKGNPSLNLTVRRGVHGPVVASTSTVRFARRRIQWQRELEDMRVFLGFMRARTLEDFSALATARLGTSSVLFADNLGNIGYWLAGWIPQRPAGYDLRFPLPGDGSAEWTGERMPVPASINPARGWLTNWNNKPAVDFDALEGGALGRFNRILEIATHLDMTSPISPDDMRDIVKDVARVDVIPGGGGRSWRVMKPYLLAALDAVPPAHPLAAQARSILEHWDGSAVASATDSTTLEPGAVIYARWRQQSLQNTFADELKASIGQANVNVLLHVLDDRFRADGPCVESGGSCVPPSRDYFNGADPNAVLSAAFDQALSVLGPDPAVWLAQPRAPITFTHFVVGPIAQIPGSARMTWTQHVILSRPTAVAESILTLGQSGFIGTVSGSPVLDPHFKDQLELYRAFQYKAMPLYRSWPFTR